MKNAELLALLRDARDCLDPHVPIDVQKVINRINVALAEASNPIEPVWISKGDTFLAGVSRGTVVEVQPSPEGWRYTAHCEMRAVGYRDTLEAAKVAAVESARGMKDDY